MRDLLLNTVRSTTNVYLNNRYILQRTTVLILIDLLSRLLAANLISNTALTFTNIVIGASVLVLLCNDKYLEKVTRYTTCLISLYLVLPTQNSLTGIKNIFRNIDILEKVEDKKFYINIYLQFLLGLSSICFLLTIFHASVNWIKRMSKKTLFSSLVACSLVCLGRFVYKYAPENSKSVFFFMEYLILTYALYRLFEIDCYIYSVLMMIHLSSKVYSPLVTSIVGLLWAYKDGEFRQFWRDLKLPTTDQIKEYAKEMCMNYVSVYLIPYSVVVPLRVSYEFYSIWTPDVLTVVVKVITIMCATWIGTLAYLALLLHMCYCGLHIVMFFLQGKNCETVSYNELGGPIFLIIFVSFQTLNIKPEVHGVVMFFLFYYVLMQLLISVQEKSEHTLLEVGTVGGPLVSVCKVIIVFVSLVVIPILAIKHVIDLSFTYNFDLFWTVLVVSSWGTISIGALGSLVIFGLLIYDNLKSEPIEKIDDYIYYIRFVTGLIQITEGILCICFVIRLIIVNKWAWSNLIILGFDSLATYSRIKEKWNEYQRRRQAAARLAFLENATTEQLAAYNDVCAICLRNMSSAKVTHCRHLFHENCLKKWSYVRETCPLCNKMLDARFENERLFRMFLQIFQQQQQQLQNINNQQR